MAWATAHIAKLNAGETVQFRPHGHSMNPKIKSGELCTVEPITDHSRLQPGDIVLCKVNGSQYLHFVSAIQGPRFQISNNKGHVNGWVTASSVYGKLVAIEP